MRDARSSASMQRKRRARTPKRNSPARRLEVRASGVHGRGVYATATIRKGVCIIEYTGEHLPWKKAMDLEAHNPRDPYHTFFFSLDNGNVINARAGGNDARWINHSCDPNCETNEENDRIFVYALRTIRAAFPGCRAVLCYLAAKSNNFVTFEALPLNVARPEIAV